ncbi:MAG: hypothetical protein MUQ10_10875 [Anaerolineae bacterium]|nr:hypothetical protein [Anaerolineae bacterium]
MNKLFAITIVGLLMFAPLVQGVSASEVCSTESVSCLTVTGLRYQGVADLATAEAAARARATQADGARYTGMAAYLSARAAWGPRAQSARYQALADYYANLSWDTATMSRLRGVGALYGR